MDADDRFDVVVLGFAAGHPEAPAAGLRRVFGIDDAATEKLLSSLPRTVQKHVPRVRAEYFRRALAQIGAEVEVRTRDGRAIGRDAPDGAVSDPLGWGAALPVEPAPADTDAARAATIVRARAAGVLGADELAVDAGHASEPTRHEATRPAAADAQVGAPPPVEPAPDASPPVVSPESLASHVDMPYPANARTIAAELPPNPSLIPEVRRPSRPPTLAARAPRERQSPTAIRRAAPAPAAPPRIDTRSFWATFGEALAVPFRGSAVYWLVAIAIWAVAMGLLSALAGFFPLPVVGLIVSFIAQSTLLAFACDFFKVCMWVPTTGEQAVDHPPRLDPERILDTYVMSGLHLSFFSILSMAPLLWWLVQGVSLNMLADPGALLALAFHPFTWLLFLLPWIYWPMGVGLTALGNNFAAIWNLPLGFRALARAPLEHLTIVAVGLVALVGSWLVLALFATSLSLPAVLLQSGGGLPLAASHGMMGALFGHLIRSRPDLLD